jgi:hypothetical protein
MPRLILFAPCERVIVEEGSNAISLISVLQELTVGGRTGTPPPDAVGPQRWFVLSIWARDGDEPSSQRFEQSITLNGPDGKTFLEMRTTFEIAQKNHRNVALIEGFPIGAAGRYHLNLKIRPVGQNNWKDAAEYPIDLIHVSIPNK